MRPDAGLGRVKPLVQVPYLVLRARGSISTVPRQRRRRGPSQCPHPPPRLAARGARCSPPPFWPRALGEHLPESAWRGL